MLRRGEALVREGDPSDRFFVVLSGRFSVHRKAGIGPVAEIAQGELVGEVGFFADLPRTATVVATRDSIVLEIGREAVGVPGEERHLGGIRILLLDKGQNK